MTIAQKIQLIDDLIRENPDVTIKDYIELEKEIGGITNTTIVLESNLDNEPGVSFHRGFQRFVHNRIHI